VSRLPCWEIPTALVLPIGAAIVFFTPFKVKRVGKREISVKVDEGHVSVNRMYDTKSQPSCEPWTQGEDDLSMCVYHWVAVNAWLRDRMVTVGGCTSGDKPHMGTLCILLHLAVDPKLL
jgi:hypothetical protein